MVIARTSNRTELIITLKERALQAARWSRFLFTPVAILAVVYFFVKNYADIIQIVSTADLALLLTSTILWCVVNISLPVVTYKLLKPGNHGLTLTRITSIHLSRLPAKYIPGGIWHTAARSVDYARDGVGGRQLFNVLALEHLMALVITAGIGGAGVYFYSGTSYWSSSGLVACLFALVALLIGIVFIALKEHDNRHIYYLQAFFTHMVTWLIASFSFLAYYHAFEFNDAVNNTVYISTSYMFAWSLGFLSFFTPQGFGVFEVVITDLLIGQSALSTAAFVFIGFRVSILFSDMLMYLGCSLLRTLKG